MVMDVMAAAARIEAAGGRVIHMEVGQPAAAAPTSAIAAARAALASGRLRYTETLGLPTLRARIARHYHDTYGVAVDSARVVVTTGSSGGFILAFLALFEPGDRVAVALPGYPPYRHILRAQRRHAERLGIAQPPGCECRARGRDRGCRCRRRRLADLHVNDATARGLDARRRRHHVHHHEGRNRAARGGRQQPFRGIQHPL